MSDHPRPVTTLCVCMTVGMLSFLMPMAFLMRSEFAYMLNESRFVGAALIMGFGLVVKDSRSAPDMGSRQCPRCCSVTMRTALWLRSL